MHKLVACPHYSNYLINVVTVLKVSMPAEDTGSEYRTEEGSLGFPGNSTKLITL